MNARWAAGLLLAAVVTAAPPTYASGSAALLTPAPEALGMPTELDGLAWTVVRTPPGQRVTLPDIERGSNLLTGNIRPLPARRVPAVFWYASGGLRYGLVFQNGPAPLMVLIPGTGSSFDAVTSQQAARVFYAAGFHVLGLPSPTHPDFIINASELWVCRRGPVLRRRSLPHHPARNRPSRAAWHGDHHGQRRRLQPGRLSMPPISPSSTPPRSRSAFRDILLLNPPVSVWNSVQILDEMFRRHVPADPNWRAAADRPGSSPSSPRSTRRLPGTSLDSDFLYSAYNALEPSDEGPRDADGDDLSRGQRQSDVHE